MDDNNGLNKIQKFLRKQEKKILPQASTVLLNNLSTSLLLYSAFFPDTPDGFSMLFGKDEHFHLCT